MGYLDEYGDDGYYEPSNADIAFGEAAEILKAAVMERVRNHFARIELEGEEISKSYKRVRDENNELWQENQKLKSRIGKLEQERSSISVAEFLGKRRFVMFKPEWEWVHGEKCDLCDENRRIEYKKPSGESAQEICYVCGDTHKFYSTQKHVLTEIEDDGDGDRLLCLGRSDSSGERHVFNRWVEDSDVWDGEDWADSKGKYFVNESDCTAYCDWLNENEKE